MKEIYKILISVTILILASSIGTAVKPTPTPNQEQVQDSRLTSLETNDTLQQINNTEQQGLINGMIGDINVIKIQIISLTNQISQLLNRVGDLENDPYPAIYAVQHQYANLPNNDQWYEVRNLTFVLPKDGYVFVQGDGNMFNWLGYAGIQLDVDGICYGNECQPAWYGDGKYDGSGEWTGFEKAIVRYLEAGTHKARVLAISYGNASGYPTTLGIRISATTFDTNKGSITQGFLTSENNKIEPPHK